MELQSTSRPAVTTEIIGQLQRMIHDGVWAVGSRIPTERVLGEELGVGRGTVREAIGALAYAGVLEVRRGDGTYVASLSELTGSVRRLRETSTGMGSLLEVRGALDVLAARLAAARRSEADVAELRSATVARDTASADAASWIDADWHFHLLIAHVSRNPLLIELYRSLETAIRDEMIASWGEDGFSPASPIGHADLVEAIANGDGERAGWLAQSNLDETSRWAG